MSRKFDLIVFGATGFTGKYVVETIVKTLSSSTPPGEPFTWAIAGRSISKLATILEEISGRTGIKYLFFNKIQYKEAFICVEYNIFLYLKCKQVGI